MFKQKVILNDRFFKLYHLKKIKVNQKFNSNVILLRH